MGGGDSIEGREDELSRIATFLDGVTDGSATLLIDGEAGTGKTTLGRRPPAPPWGAWLPVRSRVGRQRLTPGALTLALPICSLPPSQMSANSCRRRSDAPSRLRFCSATPSGVHPT